MPAFDPVAYAIPGFILLVVGEMLWAKARAPRAYEPRDTLCSLALGLGSTAAGFLTASLVYAAALWLYQFRIATLGWQWWIWAFAFVLDDFGCYWGHRTGHRVRWFWASHVNHHSSQHYNFSTALRQTWTGFIALSFLFRIPLALLGFHPAMLAAVGGFNLIYQFWIHTEAIGRMPRWFEAVMNTPSHHRVHHATNPRYLDRNYAGVFVVWDKLFGSFQPELAEDPVRYGIVRQLGSFGVLWAAFHEWIGLARDMWRAPWRHKLDYIWRVPGWTHDGSRETTDAIRERWRARP
jgi:sterol desaturase/sphingolipid hydroxylase (fatty acid hydroxylase superfamily)